MSSPESSVQIIGIIMWGKLAGPSWQGRVARAELAGSSCQGRVGRVELPGPSWQGRAGRAELPANYKPTITWLITLPTTWPLRIRVQCVL